MANHLRAGKENRSASIAYATPAVVLLGVTVAWPTIAMIGYAFTDKRLGEIPHFVGLQNFATLTADPIYWNALRTTVVFAVGTTLLKIVGGYICGAMLHAARPSMRRVGVALLATWLIPVSATAIVWIWLLYEPGGVLDTLRRLVVSRTESLDLLGRPRPALGIVMAFSVWRELPLWAVVFLAGRLSVPLQVRDQAELEFGNLWRREFSVWLRLMWPTILAAGAMALVWAYGEMQSIHLLTRGGPGHATQTIGHLAYEFGYGGGIRIGRAVACVVLSIPPVAIAAALALEASLRAAREMPFKRAR